MNPTLYRCEFSFRGMRLHSKSPNGVAAFENGFWINDDLKMTNGLDARFWIPPHKIEYIQKEAVNES